MGASQVDTSRSHEIVGEVVRVGKDVKDPAIQVGRRVGIGAQVAACYECKHCKNDNENYCMNLVHTYVSVFLTRCDVRTKDLYAG